MINSDNYSDTPEKLIWVAGIGFGNFNGGKKLLLSDRKLVGTPRAPAQSEYSKLKMLVFEFLQENHVSLGFVAWEGYHLQQMGRGAVFVDATNGLHSESVGAQFLPSELMMAVLSSSGLPSNAQEAMREQSEAYDPSSEMLLILLLENRIYPFQIGPPELTPPQCHRQMLEAAILERESKSDA